MPTHRKRRLRTLGATLALLTLTACAGKSCSCIAPIKGGYPVTQRHDNAIQIRATQSLFQYVSDHGAGLVTQILPTGNVFNVPSVCGSNSVCCDMPGPAPMCRINIAPQKLSLVPTPPDVVKLTLTTQLVTMDKLPVEFSIVIGTAKCLVSLDTTKGTAGHTDIDIAGDLQFSVEAMTDLTRVAMNNAAVNNLDPSMVTLESQPGDFLCTIANFGPIKSFVVSTIASQLASNLGSIVSSQLCMACTTKDDCNSFAAACTGGQCIEADAKTCVQELGIEGRLDVGSLLASFSPGLKAGADIIAAAGGYTGVDTGLSLGMLGGAQSDPHSSCVPMRPAPTTPMVAQSRTFFTDVLPDHATPYHLGIGIHKSELDNIGYGVFDGGGLCLDIGTKTVALLSSKTLGLVIPSLADLVHVADAPMQLKLEPGYPPTFTMGKGTFKLDASGNKVIDDPLMYVSLPSLSIDFYAFVDDRYVRIMTLTADVTLGVSIEVDATGKLVPMITDGPQSFTNVIVTHSDLLAESPQALAKAFPMLLSVAIGQIAGAIGPIALPAVLGLNIEPIAVTSTDPDADGTNQFLSIFADLQATPAPASLSLHTTARLEKLVLPTTREFAVDARGAVAPTAWLQLGSSAGDAFTVEYSFSIDEGAWSPFTPETRVGVTDARLWLQGRHTVDVRARRVGLPSSLDRSPARVLLIVDTVAPSGSFTLAGRSLSADAHDAVSPVAALQLRFSLDDGASFSDWSAADHFTLPPRADTSTVRVQARDEAGNIGELAPATVSSGGCSLAQNSNTRWPAILIVLAALLLLRRRKPHAIGRLALFYAGTAGMMGLAGMTLGGCGGLTKGDFENPNDEIGRYSDVAIDKSGDFQLSAYDDSAGDLVYASVTDPTKSISWQYVDGIDPTSPIINKGGYRQGITDPGPDVGMYTSLALDKSGRPRIAYYDLTDGAIKFAMGPHPFTSYAIESGTTSAPVGMFAALSLDGNDVPSVAYVATGLADGKSGFKGELRVAVARNATPGAGDWTIAPVDSTPISCAGRCATGSVCVVTAMVNGTANTDPSFSTCTAVDAMPCAATCTSTQACIMGACTAVLAAPGAVDLPEGTGLFVQARRDKSGSLLLIYYDHNQGSLKLATESGGAWTTAFLDGNMAGVDVGQFASAAIAADGSIHVAYADAVNQQLLYKHVVGGVAPMMAEMIDDGTRAGDMPHQVGAGANLILDDSGAPRVVYQDQTLADLELASGSPTWTHKDLLTGIAGFGFYPRQVTAKGTRWLVEFVYDRENGPTATLGTLRLSAMTE